jgi:hypothetical protein
MYHMRIEDSRRGDRVSAATSLRLCDRASDMHYLALIKHFNQEPGIQIILPTLYMGILEDRDKHKTERQSKEMDERSGASRTG